MRRIGSPRSGLADLLQEHQENLIPTPDIPQPKISGAGEYQSMLQGIIEKYQPGGPFEEAGLEQLKRKRIKGVTKRTQDIVGRGLAGTTQAGLVGTKFEEEVGMPYKLGLEEQRTAGLTAALQAQVTMRERMAALQQQRDIAEQKLKQSRQETLASMGSGAATVIQPQGKSMTGSVSGGGSGSGTSGGEPFGFGEPSGGGPSDGGPSGPDLGGYIPGPWQEGGDTPQTMGSQTWYPKSQVQVSHPPGTSKTRYYIPPSTPGGKPTVWWK